MATIRKRQGKGGTSYQAIVRHKSLNGKTLVKTFSKKALAVKWAAAKEAALASSQFVNLAEAKQVTFCAIADFYLQKVTPTKASSTAKEERYIIERVKRYAAGCTIDKCDQDYWREFGLYRKEVDAVSSDTLLKDLQKIHAVFVAAKELMKAPIAESPIAAAKKQLNLLNQLNESGLQRDRRISSDERNQIELYKPKRFTPIREGALFAIETGMRRGEISRMTWSNVDWQNAIYKVETQKTDKTRKRVSKGRDVPLSDEALSILRTIKALRDSGKVNFGEYVWPWRCPHSFTTAFSRMCKRLGIDGLVLHVCRHEFGSTETDRGVDSRKVAAAMGHTDLRSMSRYSHPDMILYHSQEKEQRVQTSYAEPLVAFTVTVNGMNVCCSNI
ncbi:site-specific integrase [Neiella marina]|uniref:Site-specific integrase n=1 Tax=Neiella holothuriorum TaxID=2870530 RepID=A0ABS7EJV9_9GAMM|nr:site-specific integrase [Neiella holothuriorum]MBW8191947.1 site-specific integrase [Neiella holothuriorum]